MKSKIYIKTFGCQMNLRDSEVICGLLIKQGCRITDDPKKAGVLIFNTCSVRQHAEDKVWSEIGRLAKQAKHGVKPVIGLVGCMAQNYKEHAFQRSPAVDFVVGPADIDKIPGIIAGFTRAQEHKSTSKGLFERKIWETDGEFRTEEIYHTGFYADKEHAYVVISEGCSNFCSYCVVPHTRGPLKHRNYQNIISEIKEALAKGATKITLLGQNVNSYRFKDEDFIALLKRVNALSGLKEFDFITSHPKDVSLDLFKAMAELERLKKSLHLPVQSGSDRILKLMNRGYNRKLYLYFIDNYRKIIENGVLTSDVIVGFPSETEEEFKDTYSLVKEARFDAAFIFKYSPRPYTEAAKMPDSVSKEEKERRHKLILDLQRSISKGIAAKKHNE